MDRPSGDQAGSRSAAAALVESRRPLRPSTPEIQMRSMKEAASRLPSGDQAGS
jgi:hypothetical protein